MSDDGDSEFRTDAQAWAVSRRRAMWIHLAGFAGLLVPLGNVIVPVVLWLMWREDDEYVDEVGREAVNFQISVLIYFFISILFALVLIGFLMMFILGIYQVVFIIIAAIRAADGRAFRIPMVIRFVKT